MARFKAVGSNGDERGDRRSLAQTAEFSTFAPAARAAARLARRWGTSYVVDQKHPRQGRIMVCESTVPASRRGPYHSPGRRAATAIAICRLAPVAKTLLKSKAKPERNWRSNIGRAKRRRK